MCLDQAYLDSRHQYRNLQLHKVKIKIFWTK